MLAARSVGCPLLRERGTEWGLKRKGGYLRAGVPQGPEKLWIGLGHPLCWGLPPTPGAPTIKKNPEYISFFYYIIKKTKKKIECTVSEKQLSDI